MSEAVDDPTADDPAARAGEPAMTAVDGAHSVTDESDLGRVGPNEAETAVPDDVTDTNPVDHARSDGELASDPSESITESITGDDAPGLGEIDLAGIEADLDGVQVALARLADGTYWTDEVTGEPIAVDVLVADPLARRV